MSALAPLRLGSRGSDLALWQARRVASLIAERLGRETVIEVISTRGDRIQDVAFTKMKGKGFFTKELERALLDRQVDLVVHSFKDLPTETPPGLAVTAIPERSSPADLLLARRGLLAPTEADPFGLPAGACLGTSSLRRAAQALALSPGLRIAALRGNVPTRVRKLREGSYDAILLAAAGVGRLGLELDDLDLLELPFEAMLPAPAQGALAIEVRADDPGGETLAALHDPEVGRLVEAERDLLRLLGGGCHLPFGCLASPAAHDAIRLEAVLGEVDNEVSEARVARVAAVAVQPDRVARACHEALRLALPEVAG